MRGYHHVVVIGKRADGLAKVLHKGSRIFVEGSLRTTTFDGRDGQKRVKTEVVASEVFFAGEKGAEVGLQPGEVIEPEELPWR